MSPHLLKFDKILLKIYFYNRNNLKITLYVWYKWLLRGVLKCPSDYVPASNLHKNQENNNFGFSSYF